MIDMISPRATAHLRVNAMLPMMGHCAMLCATTPRSLQAAGWQVKIST